MERRYQIQTVITHLNTSFIMQMSKVFLLNMQLNRKGTTLNVSRITKLTKEGVMERSMHEG